MFTNLYFGNCYDYMKSMPDKSVDLVYTDPPYFLDIIKPGSGGTVNNLGKFDETLTKINTITQQGYNLREFCDEALRVLRDINIYIWCNKKQIPEYIQYFVLERDCKFDVLVWNKTNALPTYSNKYLTDCEYCLYFHSTGKCFPKNYNDAKTVYQSPINRENKIYGHPTIKPLPFVRSMISNSTNPGDTVFDPFMGSGTTGVACKELGLNFIGCETIKEYYDTAQLRIEGVKIEDTKKQLLW